jgi:hypothetical protein
MRLCRLQHHSTMILAQRGREVLANLVERIFQRLGRKLAALLDQLKGGAQAVFQILAAAQLLDARWNRQPMALDGGTGEAQFHILQIRLEHPNLPRQIEAHRRSFFQVDTDLGELFVIVICADPTSRGKASMRLFSSGVLACATAIALAAGESRARASATCSPDMRMALGAALPVGSASRYRAVGVKIKPVSSTITSAVRRPGALRTLTPASATVDRANLSIAHAHHALVEIQANGEHFRPQPAACLHHRLCDVRLNTRRGVANGLPGRSNQSAMRCDESEQNSASVLMGILCAGVPTMCQGCTQRRRVAVRYCQEMCALTPAQQGNS